MFDRMKPPLFVRILTDNERAALKAGLRSADASTLRRCQILTASADGVWPATIAARLRCASQNAHEAPELDDGMSQSLRALLHQSPRDFGRPTSVWTLDLAAEVASSQGIPLRRVRDETIRQALSRLGFGWKRAETWITSPDPADVRKKSPETA